LEPRGRDRRGQEDPSDVRALRRRLHAPLAQLVPADALRLGRPAGGARMSAGGAQGEAGASPAGRTHVLTVVGARPQFIKAATVSRVIRACEDVRETLVHTGQHYDRYMSDVFFEELDVP